MTRPLRIEYPGAVYHGYSQMAIAEETGLHYSTVSRVMGRGWPFSKDKT
ncbi:MAG: hypothetical protein U5L00_07790 [Desulfovermiculus sp.]|nr:hypothetical protein [Desulfovermiculus sp.]